MIDQLIIVTSAVYWEHIDLLSDPAAVYWGWWNIAVDVQKYW